MVGIETTTLEHANTIGIHLLSFGFDIVYRLSRSPRPRTMQPILRSSPHPLGNHVIVKKPFAPRLALTIVDHRQQPESQRTILPVKPKTLMDDMIDLRRIMLANAMIPYAFPGIPVL